VSSYKADLLFSLNISQEKECSIFSFCNSGRDVSLAPYLFIGHCHRVGEVKTSTDNHNIFSFKHPEFRRIIECFGWEGTFRGHLAQPPSSEQGHLQLDQVAQSPVQPGLEEFELLLFKLLLSASPQATADLAGRLGPLPGRLRCGLNAAAPDDVMGLLVVLLPA